MKALLFTPGKRDSASLADIPEPTSSAGYLLVRMLAVGVCGTDRELLAGDYGWAPSGREQMVIGHESLGKVLRAPEGSGFSPGDLVVGIVRHRDPVPCENCAVGEWDMCRNGLYHERGIKELDGFCRERYELEPEYAVKVDPSLGEEGVLLEPASILAKAWEHIENIGRRAVFAPRILVVAGAGPVGLLAALMGKQRGLEVHVLDRVRAGIKPALVESLGATYHSSLESLKPLENKVDVAIECTGSDKVVLELMKIGGSGSVVCLTGVSSGGRQINIDLGALNKSIVLENEVVFGSVNANRRHYEKAARALAAADRDWLKRMITRRVPLSDWRSAFAPAENQVKTILVPDGEA